MFSCLILSKTFDHHSPSRSLSVTFEYGADVFPDGNGTGPVELAQGELHVEERHAPKYGHEHIGDEKCT